MDGVRPVFPSSASSTIGGLDTKAGLIVVSCDVAGPIIGRMGGFGAKYWSGSSCIGILMSEAASDELFEYDKLRGADRTGTMLG
jgi:hypothetical protein